MKFTVASFLLAAGVGLASAASTSRATVTCPANADGFSALLANPEDCGSYYHCVGSVPFLTLCEEGLHFDAASKACVNADVADCGGRRSAAALAKSEEARRAEMAKQPRDDIDVVCPLSADGFSVFVPYPYDCTLYYHCVGSTPVLLRCPAGLHFDTSLNVCNWPQDAGCTPTPRPTEPPTTTEASGTTVPDIGTTVSSNDTEAFGDLELDDDIDVICPLSADGYSVFIPFPYDCTMYYHCVGTVPVLRECPAGLHFDTRLETCNWPENAGCTPTPRPTEPPVTTDSSGTTVPDEGTTVSSNSSSFLRDLGDAEDDGIDVVCPLSADGYSVFVPYPYDCTLYYHCVGSTPVLRECPAGLHFDTNLNVCNWPEDAGCTPTPRPTEPPVTTDSSGTTVPDMGTTVSSNSSDLINDMSDTEDDGIDVVCPLSTDGLSVFVPYPYDCTLYYHCVGSTPVLRTCPGGLHFDTVLNVCNWPEDAGCTPTPRPTDPPASNGTTPDMGGTTVTY